MSELKRCNAVVVANTTVNVRGSVGYQLPYLISCPVCAARSIAAEAGHHPLNCRACDKDRCDPKDPPVWSGFGETYAADYSTARMLAQSHNDRPPMK